MCVLFLLVVLIAALLSVRSDGSSLLISNPSAFIDFVNKVNDGTDFKKTTIELLDDLDFNGLSPKPVGMYYTKSFAGTFNGNGHVIKNFKFSGDDDHKYGGIFGHVEEGTVTGLIVDSSCEIKSKYEYHLVASYDGAAIGGLMGYCDSCVVKDCASFASVSHSGKIKLINHPVRIGGFIGHCHENGVVKNSASGGSASFQGSGIGDIYVGGFFGMTQKASVTNIITTASVSSKDSGINIGSICGKYSNNGNIENVVYLKSSMKLKGDGKGSFGSTYELTNTDFTSLSNDKIETLKFLNDYSALKSYTQWGVFTCNSDGKTSNSEILSYFIWLGYSPQQLYVEGYTFVGWYSDESLTVPYVRNQDNLPKIFGENTNIYAKFTINDYTITFNNDQGHHVDNIVVPFNGKIELPTPKSDNRSLVFVDWYEGDKPFNLEKMPARNIDLKAVWIVHEYITYYYIFFNTSEGGSHVGPRRLEENKDIVLPDDPTREGYTFKYWYDSDPETPFNKNSMPAYNITLYAKWSLDTYYIKFDTNGGDPIGEIGFNYSGHINLPKPTNPDAMLIFDEWFEGDSIFNLEYMPARNVSLKATWTTQDFKTYYYIFFNTSEGGSYVGPRRLEANNNIVLPDNPIREGYTFKYWYESDSTVKFTGSTMPKRNITLYAEWNLNTYYMIFNTSGGDTIDPKEFKYNDFIDLPEATNTNITLAFDKWLEGGSLFDLEHMPARNVSLTATWEYIPETLRKFYVTFDTDGGSFVNSLKYYINEEITLPEDPTKEGHTFICWMDSVNSPSCFSGTKMPSKNIALYARWSINNYTITFITDEPNAIPPINSEFNTQIKLTKATRTGHEFRYWYEDNALTQFKLDKMPSRNVTLRPYFVSKNYIITFVEVENEENEMYTRIYMYNESLYTPIPKRTGYAFSQWCTKDSEKGSKLVPFNLTEMPARNFALYAEWRSSKNVLVYETGDYEVDGNDFVVMEAGSTIDKLYVPSKTGKQFCGWYMDETFKTPFNESAYDFSSGAMVFAKWC